MTPATYKQQWFGNPVRDLIAGTVVALALIPEAIAFSIIAGVDPKVGLYASFCIAVVIAFVGGRPGMISAATGAMALLMVTLVKEHGIEYLFAATLLTGVIQIVAGFLKLGDLMRFVARSVVIGFVNALAILIFLAQLPEFHGQGWLMYACVAAGLGIIYGLPLLTKTVPSPLVCIVLLTGASMWFGWGDNNLLRTVGDMGELPSAFPAFSLPMVPVTLETLWIILPYSLPLAVVGLLESLMTATIVDDYTDTSSDKNRECKGQGMANLAAGLFGGMAGCAMIGQTVINVKSGGRGRLSTFWAGLFLLILVVLLGRWVSQIPMAALVAVMIMVSIGTFSWASIKNIRVYPWTATLVTFSTVAVVVGTHNLALGVGVGVLLSALCFAARIARLLHVTSHLGADSSERVYHIRGQLFFASTTAFAAAFDFRENLRKVVIDVTHSHFWDTTSINALDKVVIKFRQQGVAVEIVGLNPQSQAIVRRLAIYDKPDQAGTLGSH
ncbi:MAG: SulP family inorganic anion transporter [Opitutaceae bacterium]|jgi:SulP family sulfate permease|nr:SulP family inorganic anion transporter [Opitutaceae bacterium]